MCVPRPEPGNEVGKRCPIRNLTSIFQRILGGRHAGLRAVIVIGSEPRSWGCHGRLQPRPLQRGGNGSSQAGEAP
jgi:hypothetical protein